ncbi:MAG: phenylacetate--CoA ligase [Armatimonadota bacterium]|nr:MAG: phenylacetate--CoA ligase [Armatimonadota bacterium]
MAQAFFWNREVECLPRPELEKLQVERLRKVVTAASERVPLYRERLAQAGVTADDISSLDDLRGLPFTTKDDLRDSFPYGMFAVPMDQIVRIHASSGTTGKQTVVGYTRGDIGVWSEVMARTLGAGGTTAGDVCHNAYGYGLFTGGLGLHYGGETIGASVIPVSGGQTKRQVQIMQDFGSTVLCCTPSYALVIAEAAAELGVDVVKLPLRVGFFGAEPWTDGMRVEIEDKLAIDALDIYGLSEIIGPGVAYECLEKKGLHIAEDHFLPEVIDPATGEPLPPGERGELVFTTLTKEALPLIRYRTRDLTVLDDSPCACGRTCRRMQRVTGRSDDMLIIRGVNVFPSQIESVIVGIEGVSPHYLLVVDRKPGKMDELEVWIEISEETFSDEMKELERLEQRVLREIESILGLSVRVKLVEPKSIARSEGKAKRVVDRRELFK